MSTPPDDLFGACFDAALTGLAVVTASGDLVAANGTLWAMLGKLSSTEARTSSLPHEAVEAVREAILAHETGAPTRCVVAGRTLAVRAGRLPFSLCDDELFLTEWREDLESSAMAALRESERRLSELQRNLPVGIYRASEDGTIETANPALLAMMGYASFEELQRADLAEVWVDVSARSRLIERLRTEGAVLGYTATLRRKDGSLLIGSFDARGTFDAEGRLLYFDTIVQDMTEQVRTRQELERLAKTDTLTGLHTRQWFMSRLAEELHRASRYHHPLSLMIIDLDHFKAVNDAYGHLAGDRVLAAAASTVVRTVRSTDFTGRYGGEEFCVAMPETSLHQACVVAERVREAMVHSPVELHDGTVLRVTCSIGAAQASSPDVDGLIAEADAALYEAKHRGRNRVVASPVP